MKGLFITFEGPEGCGKTTQARLLADVLESIGYDVILTCDPGGTEVGDKIRSVLLDAANNKIAALTELFLFLASRHQLVDEKIEKHLQAGNIVICSRYTDATLVYQGYARGLDLDTLEKLNTFATKNVAPDLTILLDIDPEIGLKRVRDRYKSRNEELDRIEEEVMEFHHKVRDGYLELCSKEPRRIKKINADDTIENIQAQVKELVLDVLEKV
ncbi:MAG: dTMP kinase [bacterium]|nr:dTMP kinase [bacterium]